MRIENRISKLEKAAGLSSDNGIAFVIVKEGETEQAAIKRCRADNAKIRFMILEE